MKSERADIEIDCRVHVVKMLPQANILQLSFSILNYISSRKKIKYRIDISHLLDASRMTTFVTPFLRRWSAAVSPAMPAPTITTSAVFCCCCCIVLDQQTKVCFFFLDKRIEDVRNDPLTGEVMGGNRALANTRSLELTEQTEEEENVWLSRTAATDQMNWIISRQGRENLLF